MIRETILTTMNAKGDVHTPPSAITVGEDDLLTPPFRPPRPLTNLLANPHPRPNYAEHPQCSPGARTPPRHNDGMQRRTAPQPVPMPRWLIPISRNSGDTIPKTAC